MSIFDSVLKLVKEVTPIAKGVAPTLMQGVIKGGKQKADGSHDHRTNTGGDRTPAQKNADIERSKGD